MSNRIEQVGGSVFTVDAKPRDISKSHDTLGICWAQHQTRLKRGQTFVIGQFYGIVVPGMIMAESIFKGLKRGMWVNGDGDADRRKFAYCWTPQNDFQMAGDKFNPKLKKLPAQPGQTFVVIVSPNDQKDQFPDIDGWIEHWSWVEESKTNPNLPLNFDDRYNEKII